MTQWLIGFGEGIGIFAGCVLAVRYVVAPVTRRHPLPVAATYTAIFTWWTGWESWYRHWIWAAVYAFLAGMFGLDVRRLLLRRRLVKGRETT